jgi:hypothetical protein
MSPYQYIDKQLMIYFLTYFMMCIINLKILNLKHHLCMEKQKEQIVLRGKLSQCA